MAMSYRAKKHGLYACIASILVFSQAIEAASYETGSWKERLYAGLYSWWNTPRTPYPDWAKYAFVGGLGIAAIAAAYTLWSQRSQKSKPGEQPTAPRQELTLEEQLHTLDPTTAPRQELTLEEQLNTLDPTMARVYKYLNSLGTDVYQNLVYELIQRNKIPNNLTITPLENIYQLDLACEFAWDAAAREELAAFVAESQQTNIQDIQDITNLNKEVQPEDYITIKYYNNTLQYALMMVGSVSNNEDVEKKQNQFFKEFVQESFPVQWDRVILHSNLIASRIKKLFQTKESNPAEAIRLSLLMQTKTIIKGSLNTIKKKDASLTKYIDDLIAAIDGLKE